MKHSRTLGNIHLRGGHAGACPPDAGTPAALASPGYADSARQGWAATPAPRAAALPDRAFLSRWVAVDQRPRNTCTAFAAAAAVEMLRHGASGTRITPVSAQFIYWLMRHDHALPEGDRPPGYDIGATRLSQARDVLEQSGVCPDALAPFHLGLTDPETAPAGTEPSAEARAAADASEFAAGEYGFYPTGQRPAESLTALFHRLLTEGRPVCAGFPMFGTTSGRSNWHSVGALMRGEVLGPLDDGAGIAPGTAASTGHVVCLVGYLPEARAGEEGWFVFRNSWGLDFGRAGNRRLDWLPPGYGTISAAHVDQFCWEYYAPKLAAAQGIGSERPDNGPHPSGRVT